MKARHVDVPWGRRKYKSEPVTWLPKTVEKLRLLAPTMTLSELSREFKRSPDAIRMYCRKHKISVRRAEQQGKWTEEENAVLTALAGTIPAAEIAAILGRTESAVRNRCKVRGLSVSTTGPRRYWSEEEEEFLISNHKRLTIIQMSEHLGRTYDSTAQKCQAMGLDSPYEGDKNHSTRYSTDDVRLCRALFAEGLSRRVISEKMEIPYQRVCDIVGNVSRKNG